MTPNVVPSDTPVMKGLSFLRGASAPAQGDHNYSAGGGGGGGGRGLEILHGHFFTSQN